MNSGGSSMAATLFVLIGETASAEVLKHLTEAEIESISRAISNAGPVAAEEAEKSAEELYQTLTANRYVSEGGVDYAKKVILRTLGAGPAKRIMERLSSSYANANSFDAIDRLNPIQLSQFIQNEHPQTIALILAHLSVGASALLLDVTGDGVADGRLAIDLDSGPALLVVGRSLFSPGPFGAD